jgi:hypothetical protein
MARVDRAHRRTQLDHEEHHRLLVASRATLHGSRLPGEPGASPLVVEPGGWRSKTAPTYLTRAEAAAWLSASTKRKRCKICTPDA